MDIDVEERPKELVRKPYVLNGECWSRSSRSLSGLKRASDVFILQMEKLRFRGKKGTGPGFTKLILRL